MFEPDTDDGDTDEEEPVDTGIVGPVRTIAYPAPPASPPREVLIEELQG